MTQMEDDQMENDPNEKRPKWKLTQMEEDSNGRQPKWKTIPKAKTMFKNKRCNPECGPHQPQLVHITC